MLKRHLKIDIESRAKDFPNLARLSIWVNELIPCNFDVLKVREDKMFQSVEMLTSSADFIKAVREENIEATKAILKLNVMPRLLIVNRLEPSNLWMSTTSFVVDCI